MSSQINPLRKDCQVSENLEGKIVTRQLVRVTYKAEFVIVLETQDSGYYNTDVLDYEKAREAAISPVDIDLLSTETLQSWSHTYDKYNQHYQHFTPLRLWKFDGVSDQPDTE